MSTCVNIIEHMSQLSARYETTEKYANILKHPAFPALSVMSQWSSVSQGVSQQEKVCFPTNLLVIGLNKDFQ